MNSKKDKCVDVPISYACLLVFATLMIFGVVPASHAAPASDTKTITIRVVIPPKLNARVFSPGQTTAQNYSVCIAGSGVGQFRMQNLSQDGDTISDYSPSYPVHADQLQDCTHRTAIPVLTENPVASDPSVVMITAE